MLADPKLLRIYRHPYDDEYRHFGLYINGGHQSAYDEFYAMDSDIRVLGEQLERFPEKPMARVEFEIGEAADDRAEYLKLVFYLRDLVGHAALKVHFISRGDDLVSSNIGFAFSTEVSAINHLGVALKSFALSSKDQMEIML